MVFFNSGRVTDVVSVRMDCLAFSFSFEQSHSLSERLFIRKVALKKNLIRFIHAVFTLKTQRL